MAVLAQPGTRNRNGRQSNRGYLDEADCSEMGGLVGVKDAVVGSRMACSLAREYGWRVHLFAPTCAVSLRSEHGATRVRHTTITSTIPWGFEKCYRSPDRHWCKALLGGLVVRPANSGVG
jgi:hypothetical protein